MIGLGQQEISILGSSELKDNMTIETTDVKNEEKFDVKDLDFVKLMLPRLIPVELIEAVKGRTFTPEQFYDYQERVNDSPFNFLFVLVDKSKIIKGYLWAESNMLDNTLFVNTFSISKEYWGKGQAINLAIEFVRELKRKIKAPRVFWITTNAKFFKKHGFVESKNVLMEYNFSDSK